MFNLSLTICAKSLSCRIYREGGKKKKLKATLEFNCGRNTKEGRINYKFSFYSDIPYRKTKLTYTQIHTFETPLISTITREHYQIPFGSLTKEIGHETKEQKICHDLIWDAIFSLD